MHFEKLHSHQLLGKAQENVLKDLKNKELNFMLQSNLDQPFTENDTKAIIKLLESKKAPGLDRKRSEMLKCGIHVLAPSLTILFNFILKTGSVQMLGPIFKSGDKSEPSNYRGTYLRHQLPREIILFSIE